LVGTDQKKWSNTLPRFISLGKILMGNSIVTEADRKATPAPKPIAGMNARTGGHGQQSASAVTGING
jgi:hypothetical protein